MGEETTVCLCKFNGLIGSIICVASGNSYATLLAGRLRQGFGTTAHESLSTATIGDLYLFLHFVFDLALI